MNLLVTGAWKCTESDIAYIERLGYNVYFVQNESDELPLAYECIDAVICNGLFVYHDIRKFTHLRLIQLTSAGFDRVPMEYIEANNIVVYNAKGVYSIPMAEFVLSGVLQLYKQSRFFVENQKLHKWNKHRELLELNGRSVCVIGCGSVGTECAKRFAAFGCKVVGVDQNSFVSEVFDEIVSINRLDDVLALADVVVLCLPFTNSTHHLIGYDQLNRIKCGSILVNVARGQVLDYEALVKCMPRLGGAVLDVFEYEPLIVDSPLWDMENVVITPHNSFVGDGNDDRLRSVIYKNLQI